MNKIILTSLLLGSGLIVFLLIAGMKKLYLLDSDVAQERMGLFISYLGCAFGFMLLFFFNVR